MAYLKLLSLMALTVIKSTALSTPIQPSLNTTAAVATTPPYLPLNTSLNTSLNTNLSDFLAIHGHPVCTNNPQWQLPGDPGAGIYAGACFMALRQMEYQESINLTPYRFLSADSRGQFQEVTVQTPKRFRYTRKSQFQTVKAERLISSSKSWNFLYICRRDAVRFHSLRSSVT